MQIAHYGGWEKTDPTPILARKGMISLSNPKTPLIKDHLIPDDNETFAVAHRVLESLSLIGELPASCKGPDCGHTFRGSLRESRVTLLVQRGDGAPAPPLTYCPTCFEELYRPMPKVERESLEEAIWRLKGSGLNQREIANEIGKSQQTVSRIWKRIASREKPTSTLIH